jgi:predicted XRE-type DNA-binding protein
MAKIRTERSSGNVFADLGFADAEELDLKAALVMKIADVMRALELSQTAAAKLTGISQPDLSRVLRGRFRDMSADRLIRALIRLGSEVEIEVSRCGERVGEVIHLEGVAALGPAGAAIVQRAVGHDQA